MKKLKITRERFEKSRYFQKKYGKLKYISESGRTFKTEKGEVLRFVNEAREYVDDDSIETDSAEEFIIFDDPDIFKKIAEIQTKKGKEIQDEVKSGEVDTKDVATAADKAVDGKGTAAAGIAAAGGIASAAINAAGNLATSQAALGVAAAAGYKHVLDKAMDAGQKFADDHEKEIDAIGKNIAGVIGGFNPDELSQPTTELNKKYQQAKEEMTRRLMEYAKISNLGHDGSDAAIQMDKRAMYLATQLKNGGKIIGSTSSKYITPEQAMQELTKRGYVLNQDGIVNRSESWVDPKAVATGAVSAGATAAAGGATAAGGTGAAGASGWTLFGLSATTVGWIVAGVAAAAIITPYIYDKVRACTKTWMADIIAEIKFRADGKNYRCFYDLDDNKWVLTYADIKWTSYFDNKLDKETIEEFFASKFFANFLDKCKKTFAFLFSTGKNEVVFKSLPEIKDAPKELKDILEKIYDNKGAITKNLFTGVH